MDTRVQGSPAAPPPAPPAVAGDLVGECTLLCKQLQGQQLCYRRQGVQHAQRKRTEFERLRHEQLRRQRAARKKKRMFKLIGRISAGISAGLGLTLYTGVEDAGAAYYGHRADSARRSAMRSEIGSDEAESERSEALVALDRLVQEESRAARRLVSLLSSRAEGRRLAAGLRPGEGQ